MTLTAKQFIDLMPDGSLLESDEPEMESSLHYNQLLLLVSCLEYLWQGRSDFFIGANLTIYFSRQQLKTRDFRGPDFFLVKDTEPRPRLSWVVWEENGAYPSLIIELLSDSTENVDRTVKKDLYQNQFRTREYFWFSPATLEFEGFQLVTQSGNRMGYLSIAMTTEGYRWSDELELYLGIHEGRLRYFDAQKQLIPTPAEAANFEIQRTNLERQRADQEQQRADGEQQRANEEQQRANEEQQRADGEQQRADGEQQRADGEQQRADQERLRADQEEQRAAQEKQRAAQEKQRADRLAQQLRSAGLEPEL
jgi:Uma2 family endonuclease